MPGSASSPQAEQAEGLKLCGVFIYSFATMVVFTPVFQIIRKNASSVPSSGEQKQEAQKTKENQAAAPLSMKITARELADDFDANQVAAEASRLKIDPRPEKSLKTRDCCPHRA